MGLTRSAGRFRDGVRRRRQSSRRWLDQFYAAEHDPYHFDGNAYEGSKFEDLLGALGERHHPRALEVGCSIGSFTERLAPHCDALLAIDITQAAVERTRTRVSALPHVRVERRTVPSQLPTGPFELIVCSDVLYYLPVRRLRRTLDRLADSVAPGGSIVALHWLGDLGAPISGDTVHDELGGALALWDHAVEEHRVAVGPAAAGYRLDRFDRPSPQH